MGGREGGSGGSGALQQPSPGLHTLPCVWCACQAVEKRVLQRQLLGDHHITKKLYNRTSKKEQGVCVLGPRSPSAAHLLGFVARRALAHPLLGADTALVAYIHADRYLAEMARLAQDRALAKDFDGLIPAAPCRLQNTSSMAAFDASEHSLNSSCDIICLGVLAGANDGALFQPNQVANSNSLLRSQPEVSGARKLNAGGGWDCGLGAGGGYHSMDALALQLATLVLHTVA